MDEAVVVLKQQQHRVNDVPAKDDQEAEQPSAAKRARIEEGTLSPSHQSSQQQQIMTKRAVTVSTTNESTTSNQQSDDDEDDDDGNNDSDSDRSEDDSNDESNESSNEENSEQQQEQQQEGSSTRLDSEEINLDHSESSDEDDDLFRRILAAAAARGIPLDYLASRGIHLDIDDGTPVEYPFDRPPTSLDDVANFIQSEKCKRILVLAG